jgi:predicted RNase H-like nuclease (RuvC/YqgF family)
LKAKIALATVSGKAYYELVKELKERKLLFLSLTPEDKIPLYIKAVITTKEEQNLISHSNVLIFNDEIGAEAVIDEAVRVAKGKRSYDKGVIGIDPGKTFGLAVLADGEVLDTVACSSLGETVNTILKALDRAPAVASMVRIGDGSPIYTKKLLHLLDKALPKEVVIETVSEAGTSHFMRETTHQRGSRDLMSAMKIAERRGEAFPRRQSDET